MPPGVSFSSSTIYRILPVTIITRFAIKVNSFLV
jgi:hypothetical protein